MLTTEPVSMLVSMGSPDAVAAATDPEFIQGVVEEMRELDLSSFLAAAPGGQGGLD